MIYYFDMDGVLVNMPNLTQNDYSKLNSPLWIANLPPFTYNVAVANWLIDQGHKVYILSTVPSKNNQNGKILWIQKHLPKLPQENIILTTDIKKENYIKENGILIDDKERNCKLWFKKTGNSAYFVSDYGQNIDVNLLLKLKH